MANKQNTRFPIGGPREPVYAYLRSRGFVMSNWSDKHWTRADGLELVVYGAGSMARVIRGGLVITETPLAELSV